MSNLSQCSSFECPHPVIYLNINAADNRAMGGWCYSHGEEMLANPLPGFRLEKIPDPQEHRHIPERKEPPLMSEPVQPPLSATPQPTGAAAAPPPPVTTAAGQVTSSMRAPGDAVFDFDEPHEPIISTEQASSNFTWRYGNKNIFRIQTTVRSALTREQIAVHIQTVIDTLTEVVSRHGKGELSQPAAAPQQTQAAAAAAPPAASPPAAAATPPVSAPAGTPPPPTGTPPAAAATNGKPTSGSFVAVEMVVEPKATGKTTISFYAPGHQFADASIQGEPALLVQLMQQAGQFTEDHFRVAQKWPCKYLITWENSKRTNRTGNPYRDVKSIVYQP